MAFVIVNDKVTIKETTGDADAATEPPPIAATTPPTGELAAGTERIGPNGGVMVWVPPGEFMMGSENGEEDEKPVHRVRITKGFWLGKCEVTVGQYLRFARATSRGFDWVWNGGDPHPVTWVTWKDARAYCDYYGLSLPTEAE